MKTETQAAPFPFSPDEWATLLRCSRALHRWAELCCNHDIEEDDDGIVMARYQLANGTITRSERIPNRRRGAIRRAVAIASRHGLACYEQGDPRGAALYVYHPADLGERDIDTCYSTIGTAVV
jgi:hypothetical protein